MQPRRRVRRCLAFHSHLPGASKHVSEESTSTRPPWEKLPKCHCHGCSVAQVLNRSQQPLATFLFLLTKLRFYIDFCLYSKYNNSNNDNNGLDFHWVFCTQASLKALAVNPSFIHSHHFYTGGGKQHV